MSGIPSATEPGGSFETPRDIVRRVAEAHGLTLADLRGRCRRHVCIAARRRALDALLDAHPTASLPQLGRWIGKHHTTVLATLRAIGRGTAAMRANAARPPRRKPAPPSVTPSTVIAAVARRHGLAARVVTDPDLTRRATHARREAMAAVADAFPGMRPGEVAALFGRERTAVVRARIALASLPSRSLVPQPESRPC